MRISKTASDLRKCLTLLLVVLRYYSSQVYRIAVFGFLIHHLGVRQDGQRLQRRDRGVDPDAGSAEELRNRLCEPKNNRNPRYHALSAVVSQLGRGIDDLNAEGRG